MLCLKIKKMRDESSAIEKQVEKHHSLVSMDEPIPAMVKSDNGVAIGGYLYKRTSNAFKTWHRRWFMIKDHQLVYQKRLYESDLTIMEDDLRLCSVKPLMDFDRRFCFEIVSPSK